MLYLITRIVGMELVWRKCEERFSLLIFYREISFKIVWCFHGESIGKSNYSLLHNFSV